MKRFDRDCDGRLKYAEFCDAFLPVDSFHASLLAKKAPMQMFNMVVSKDKIFYNETKHLFANAWMVHLRNEEENEKLRKTTCEIEDLSL